MKKIYYFISLIFILSHVLMGCSGKPINEDDPESLYQGAEEDISDRMYLQALDRLRVVKNRFPYSKYSTMAALRMADVYFLEDSFAEAAASYEAFRDLHPKYEKADYVLFRIGESYYRQIPSTTDRDLTPATRSIESFNELKKVYPSSSYVAEADKLSKEAFELLAEKELYIADFYFKKGMYDSAAARYEKVVKNYSGTAREEYAYMRLSKSLDKQDKSDESKHIFQTYKQRFPQGKYKE